MSTSHLLIFCATAFGFGATAATLCALLWHRSVIQKLSFEHKYQKWSDDDVTGDELASNVTDGDSDSQRILNVTNQSEDLKVVLCVRTDLQMAKGKMCAQCGHASLGIYRQASVKKWPLLNRWLSRGQRKIALKVQNEQELHQLYAKATQQKIPCTIIYDAGRTQIAAGSATVLAIGPASDSMLDPITGHLKLL